MRIGIMCHSSIGGSARIGTELSVELARRGHRVHLFTRTTPFGYWNDDNRVVSHQIVLDQEDDLHPSSLYVNWTERESQMFLSCILQLIAEEGLDILHFHYAIPFAFIAGEIKRRLKNRAPLLMGTLHGTDVYVCGRDPLIGPLLAQTLRGLDQLTTVSFNFARLASGVLGLPKFPEVIPNFVNLSNFKPQRPSQEYGLENQGVTHGGSGNKKKVRIVHVSNFRSVKDPQSMAYIFLGIREKMDAELWLIGDGPEMDQIKSFFKQKGVENEVCFWGLRHHVAPLLAKADLLLMSSLYESFCLAALEAMACGVPVLATNVGGLPEVVIHGKTGFLFPVGDHGSAVDFAVNMFSDLRKHGKMKKEATLHARSFGHEKIVSVYEELYERSLRNRLCPADTLTKDL